MTVTKKNANFGKNGVVPPPPPPPEAIPSNCSNTVIRYISTFFFSNNFN